MDLRLSRARFKSLFVMSRGFLAMQLAVASRYGDEQIHPLVRRLWSAARGATHVPAEIEVEIEACAHDLLTIARDSEADRDERLRHVQARVEDIFVALALLTPSTAA
jgi:hypothetical protein